MGNSEVKPVDSVIPAREFEGQLWVPANVAFASLDAAQRKLSVAVTEIACLKHLLSAAIKKEQTNG